MSTISMNQLGFVDASTGSPSSVYITTENKFSVHSPISSSTSNKSVVYEFPNLMSNVSLDGIYRLCQSSHTGPGVACSSSKIETIGVLDNYAASKIILQWKKNRTDNWSDVDTIYVDSNWTTRQIYVGGQVNWMYDSNGNTKSSLSYSSAGYYRLYITVIGSRWNTQGTCSATQFGYTFNTYITATELSNHTIYYYVDGSQWMSATKFYGETYYITGSTPSKTGYTFKGWDTSSSASTVRYKSGDSYTDDSSDRYLYAVFEKTPITCTFNAHLGSVSPSSKTVYYGSTFGTLPTPTRTGYDFLGWYSSSSGGTQYTSSSTVWETSDFTIHAQWSIKKYQIKYYSGSTLWKNEEKTHNVNYYLTTQKPTPSTDYVFKGWDTSSSATTVRYDPGQLFDRNEALTLYAVFTRAPHTITYSGNGNTSGTAPSSTTGHTYGSTFTTASKGNLEKTGYTFTGWNTYSSGGGEHYDAGKSYNYKWTVDLSLNAEWSAKPQYYCTYKKNDGYSAYTKKLMGYAGDSYSLISLPSEWARSGYTFKGWFELGGGTVQPGHSFTISKDVEYYAYWVANTYYINYNSNGGSGYMERSTVVYNEDAFAKSNSFTYSGKQFVGWNSKPDGTGDWYTPGVTFKYLIAGNLELYAQWGTLVTLTFDANNSTGGTPPSSVSGLTGETTQIPGKNTLVGPEGTNFAGWNTLADGSGSSYTEGNTYTFGSTNTTLYAIWSAIQYNVTVIQPEHGTITPSSGTYAHGTQVVYSVTTEDGYYVSEWSVTGTSTFDESSLTLTVLSATTITCTLEYNPGPSVQVNVDTHGAVTVPQSVYSTIAGTPITVSATYQSGQSYDTVDIIQGTCTVASTTGSSFTITPQTNCTVRIRAKHPLPTPIVSNQINKYQIVVYNGTNMVILTRGIRKDDQNKIVWVSDVNISSRLDGVGSGSFTLHTDANYTDSIVAIDSDMLILEDGIPVYYGTITSVKRAENNFYGNHVFTGIQEYSIGFAEASRSLNYKPSSDGGVITTNPGGIVYNILGNDMTGDIDCSTSSTTFTISSQNKLSLLDKLGDQVGWRYRCRPYIISVENSTSGRFPTSGSSGTITGVNWRNLNAGDLIIVRDGTSTHVYRCNTTANSATSVSFTGAKHTSSASLVSPTVCRVRRFMIDFKPSFYQSSSVLIQDSTIPSSVTNRKAWGTNYSAMSNNDSDSDSVKYGSVSVSSPQGNGIVYSSTIPLIKSHNKDYSYSESTYVSYSYDSAISGWTWNATDRHLTFVIAGGDESKIYALFNERGALNLAMNYYPNNLVDKERGLYKYLNVYYGDENVDQTVGDAALIAITSEYPNPNTWIQIKVASGSRLEYYLTRDMVELDSISSTHYTLSSAGNLVSQPVTHNVSVQLGGEACVSSIYQSGELVVSNRAYPDLYSDGSYYPAYQHRIGCIVMKGTTQSADSDSPYAKYPERTLCAEMQSGYPYIDVDYIASNYALFGSNFDSQGTCKVPLVKFTKSDSQKYNLKGLLNVGDHIAIYKSYSSGSDASRDYELLEYKVDLDKMMVDVKYGTKTIDLGSTLYNLRKNISTNITRF